jgi:hypothetical protein
MADEQQLAVLRQGAEAWNAWRDRNPNIQPNLSGAKLCEVNFSEADLT